MTREKTYLSYKLQRSPILSTRDAVSVTAYPTSSTLRQMMKRKSKNPWNPSIGRQ